MTEGILPPGLYLVASPIGHLQDVTLRALEVLAGADLLACEDTRHTRRLLDRHGISARTTAYHAHNEHRQLPHLLDATTITARGRSQLDLAGAIIQQPLLERLL